MKTQQLEIKLSNKTEEDIKKARRKSTQAGECGPVACCPLCPHLVPEAWTGEAGRWGAWEHAFHRARLGGAGSGAGSSADGGVSPHPTQRGLLLAQAQGLWSGGGQTPPGPGIEGSCPCLEFLEVQTPPTHQVAPPPRVIVLQRFSSSHGLLTQNRG